MRIAVDTALAHLSLDPTAPLDLAELALHLARDEYPTLDIEACLSELAGMAHEAKRYQRGNLDGRVTGLCRYLFHDMGFRGNQAEYYDPRNSYFNQVIERKTGIPITLTMLAMAVGQRAGLTVAGIGLPGHFIAMAQLDGEEILFDPFHGGRRLSSEQCERLVEKLTGNPFTVTEDTFQPMPLGLLLTRMLTNLKAIYLREGDFARATRTIERLRQLAPDDPYQHRDLGISLLNNGQPGRAIDHLSAYLRAVPANEDAISLRHMLHQAESLVARWN
jgi:regulator of sirC expression with transglutaminase-like and TPR domain